MYWAKLNKTLENHAVAENIRAEQATAYMLSILFLESYD